jgi:threonine/homoserine/homoserine lactone efflux protein
MLAAFACTLGIVPHLVAAITGLAALLHASGVAFNAIKYAGVAYLLYLAWVTWRDTGTLSLENAPERATARSVIATGVTINLLNPKRRSSSSLFCRSSFPPAPTAPCFTCWRSPRCSWP